MRRFIFYTLTAILLSIMLARSLLPPPAQYAMASVNDAEYNVLPLEFPTASQTAGSALIAEMSTYYSHRIPTRKNVYSGILSGKNLILICAVDWTPDLTDHADSPALYRLYQDGAKFTQVYRPDWFQGTDGVEFALLSGLMPTRANDTTALHYVGEQNIFLPYAPARCFADAGYATYAFIPDADHAAAYSALGFDAVKISDACAQNTASEALLCADNELPFFAFFLWSGEAPDEHLSTLMETLPENTAVCILTSSEAPERAQLFLWSHGLPSPETDTPCSELDLAPTLENLFGLSFDSRFLSGRDIFAETTDTPDDATPLVPLQGSAFSDWVTEAGCYTAAGGTFLSTAAPVSDAYIEAACEMQYNRYIFARRLLENNYFSLLFN